MQRFNSERGSATLEFIGFGLLLQMPLIPFALQLSAVQLEQLAAESIARNAMRAYSISGVPVTDTINQIAQDFHLPSSTEINHSLVEDANTISLRLSVGQAEALVIGPNN